MSELMGPEELEAALRAIGAARYHNLHPFHALLHGGKLNRGQVQAWALNRYYYQSIIPLKDAAVLSRMTDRDTRRAWRQRIIDHDGDDSYDGGIERWLRLTDTLGFDRDYVISGEGLLPGTRFAVEAYLHFVRERSLLEAVASSLTELFAPDLMADRLAAFERHYTWIDPRELAYFRSRLTQAPRDSEHGLAVVRKHCITPETQAAALAALSFKCDVLWSMLDAIDQAYGKH